MLDLFFVERGCVTVPFVGRVISFLRSYLIFYDDDSAATNGSVVHGVGRIG